MQHIFTKIKPFSRMRMHVVRRDNPVTDKINTTLKNCHDTYNWNIFKDKLIITVLTGIMDPFSSSRTQVQVPQRILRYKTWYPETYRPEDSE